MRIISGSLKGRKIPNIYKVDNVSPSSDFLKGVLFNVIGTDIAGKVFCDLYAGSGNVGFEALSRGASFCIFVENSPALTSMIKDLSIKFGVEKKVKIIKKEVVKALETGLLKQYEPEYIFLDPPYNAGFCEKTINCLLASPYNENENTVIVQHDKREVLCRECHSHELFREKKHGRSVLSFYSRFSL